MTNRIDPVQPDKWRKHRKPGAKQQLRVMGKVRKPVTKITEAWHIVDVIRECKCTQCGNTIPAGSRALKANEYYQHINCLTH